METRVRTSPKVHPTFQHRKNKPNWHNRHQNKSSSSNRHVQWSGDIRTDTGGWKRSQQLIIIKPYSNSVRPCMDRPFTGKPFGMSRRFLHFHLPNSKQFELFCGSFSNTN
ncbi:hypothetical protein AVEN_11534-1 [Araneus ventricosus]|uniref:Uncharacterized protein n=1 Tax=Araneus ventricosus TaxID=182803 RepID=A0A4Y2MA41_ARAVE|nr:hypothetical protein AVEN_11534-1 [Araneus ventricosus]